MRIKKLLGWLVLAGGLALLVFGGYPYLRHRFGLGAGSVRPARGHSLLLVTLDTTRADHLGCYGGDARVTPALDGLARGGAVFEDVTATAPITLPSHASMLTGLYPVTHGVRNNGMFSLGQEWQTLAAVLSGRGYATGAFVSAQVLTARYGLDRGFDVYDDDLSQGRSFGRHSVPERRGDVTVSAALEWLASLDEDRSFFCWIHLYDPHAPYDPPPEFRRQFPGEPYTGEIAFADSMVGRVLQSLEESGCLSTTLVSVVADHGEGLGEHGEQTHAILMHRATIHVPWILAGSNIPAGRRISTPVSGADVAPTLAGLLGAPAPNDGRADGVSVMQLLAAPGPATDRPLLSETLLPRFQYGWHPLYVLRRDRWQLVSGRREELFDLRRDPRELADVALGEPAVVNDLAAALNDLVGYDRNAGGEQAKLQLSRSEIERLQALGYLGSEVAPRPDPPDPRELIGAHVHMERARQLSSRGNLDEARAELDLMLADDPGNVSGWTMRAQMGLQQQRFDEAQTDLERCLTIDPDNATAYAIMARLELSRGHPKVALELTELGAGKRGAFDTLTVLRSQALIVLDRADEAVALLDEQLREHPDSADLLAARSRLHVRDGALDQAEVLLRQAVTSDPLHSGSSFALAELLQQRGRDDEATGVLDNLLRIDPGNPAALAALGRARLDDPARARPYLEEAVRLNPSRVEPLVSLGVCYLQLEMADRAEASLRRALALRPDEPHTRNNLAIALFMQGRFQEAEDELHGILGRWPEFAEAHNNLALTLQQLGRTHEAEQAARESIRLLPEQRDARITLATLLHDRGAYNEEVEVLRPLTHTVAADPQLAARYGEALQAAGDCESGEAVLERALSEYPQEPRLLIAAARCAEATGEPARAARLYERAAQTAPPGDIRSEAAAAIERLATAIY